MTFKDIVNKDVVNLAHCEHEPIHIPGSIQPYGFLLGLKIADLSIDFCSGNIIVFTKLSHQQVLGKQMEVILGSEQTGLLTEYIACNDQFAPAPLKIMLAGNVFNCTHHIAGTVHVLEFDPQLNDQIAVADFYRQTKQFTYYMQQAGTLKQLCQSVADETRAITGYDRVMVCRFDEQYNGEVYAESRIDSIEPFLGLHYPQSDIPVQARELYMRNLLRLIVDVDYSPAHIYTIDDSANKNIDLSLAVLRSVSPIHLQYLKNMGVRATLTISLLHNNRLWGLISCHHYSPKYVSYDARIAAQIQGHFLTSQIDVREVAEEYGVAKKANKALDQLLAEEFTVESFTIETLIAQPQLTDLTNAASVIIEVGNEIYSQGNVPPADEIRKLTNWLHTLNSPTGFSTDKLSTLYPDAKKWCETVSGIIFHSLGSGHNNAIIWCRPHSLEEVQWAGDPQKSIIKDEKGLSPRKSFGIWKEVKNQESTKWLKPELLAAVNFANALQKQLYMMFLSREELKQRKLSEKLKEANLELENINWIGSHDLQEPLRKIQVFASKIIDDEDKGRYALIIASVKKMDELAKRMQLLIKDILSYSYLRNMEAGFIKTDLNTTISIVLDELKDEIIEKNAIVEFSNLPEVKGIPVLLQQLLINLIRNALKFTNSNINPHITIANSGEMAFPLHVPLTDTFNAITIRDNGIGFNTTYNESIFKVFTRLHNQDKYAGSGVGLALCRKIMKNHNGYISATGIPGKGAVFTLFFPAL